MEMPVIGITVDSEPPGGYSGLPWYALRENYADAVGRAGGLPVMLPHMTDLAETYLETISGLVVAGGDFDVDPALFGATERHETVRTKDGRTAFELAVARAALGARHARPRHLRRPAAAARGPRRHPDPAHSRCDRRRPRTRADQPAHRTRARGNGQKRARSCAASSASPPLAVNSAHHQAAADAPDGVVVNALAPDGVIEGIEAPSRRFCLGVQWHPEYAVSEGDGRIFTAFVEACRRGG